MCAGKVGVMGQDDTVIHKRVGVVGDRSLFSFAEDGQADVTQAEGAGCRSSGVDDEAQTGESFLADGIGGCIPVESAVGCDDFTLPFGVLDIGPIIGLNPAIAVYITQIDEEDYAVSKAGSAVATVLIRDSGDLREDIDGELDAGPFPSSCGVLDSEDTVSHGGCGGATGESHLGGGIEIDINHFRIQCECGTEYEG